MCKIDWEEPAAPAQPEEAPAADSESDTTERGAPVTKARLAAVTASAVEQRKQLDDAEALLRTQHFADARKAFTRLSKGRLTRGRALVALAELAFQEKNYQETIRSAKLATKGGGKAHTHIQQNNTHVRMNEFPAA